MTFESQFIQHQLTAWLGRRTPGNGVRRVAALSAGIASEVGNVREENQDRSIIVRGRDRSGRDYAIVVVADGIGGMREGARCASIALASFVAAINDRANSENEFGTNWLRYAAESANAAVHMCLRGDGGSTLVALIVRVGDETASWLSIGDSRVYRSSDKQLIQVSVDDTIAGQLGKDATGLEQSKLLQYVGMGQDLEPHVGTLNTSTISDVLLTTDGVHYLASRTDWLGSIIHNAADPGIGVKRLVDLAKWCGGPDNATAAIVRFPIEWEREERLLNSVLEVWDSYGDLQLITNSSRDRPSPLSLNEFGPPQSNSGAEQTEPQFDTAMRSDSASVSGTNPKNGRATKGQRKNTKAADRDKKKAESEEDDTPQLRMEFPSKSDS